MHKYIKIRIVLKKCEQLLMIITFYGVLFKYLCGANKEELYCSIAQNELRLLASPHLHKL